MVIDTSARIAILLNEPASPALVAALEREPMRRVSRATLVEATIVVQARLGDPGETELNVLLDRLGVEFVDVDRTQSDLARSAVRRFGKGRHPAALNFGDCFSYAFAISLGEPLLFVGHGVSQTDVDVAPW